jgi:hypothetical protein
LTVWKLRISPCKVLGYNCGGGGVRTGRKVREIACAGEEERVVFKLYTSGRYLRGM